MDHYYIIEPRKWKNIFNPQKVLRLWDSFSMGVTVTKNLSNFKMKINKFVNERIMYVMTCIRERVAKLSQEALARPTFLSMASEKQELWLVQGCCKKFWNMTLEIQIPPLLIISLLLILVEIFLASLAYVSDVFSSKVEGWVVSELSKLLFS